MDLGTRLLRQFIAVAEELNFTRAAARMFVAQQALSQQIRRLEEDLGVRLFERSTRQVSLTAAGESLLADARRIVADADAAVERARMAAAGRTALLRVGFAAGAMHDSARYLLDSFEQAHPDIQVRPVETSWTDPSSGLLPGACDVAIVVLPNGVPGLETAVIDSWDACVAQSRSHPTFDAVGLTAEDLRDRPTVWYDVPPESFYDHWNVGAPAVRAATALTWITAVASGRGVGVVSSSVKEFYTVPSVAYLPVTGLPAITFAFATRAGSANTAARALLAHTRRLKG